MSRPLISIIGSPAVREAQARRAYVSPMFYLKNIFTDFCQTEYLNIYRTDLQKISRIGRTSAVDEHLK